MSRAKKVEELKASTHIAQTSGIHVGTMLEATGEGMARETAWAATKALLSRCHLSKRLKAQHLGAPVVLDFHAGAGGRVIDHVPQGETHLERRRGDP